MIPLSKIPSAPFLSSSDSIRACIDKHGRLRSDDNLLPPNNNNNSNANNANNNPTTTSIDSSYILGIAEEDDLPDISRLTIDAFGADAITFGAGGGDFSPLERALLQPPVMAFNAYTNVVAFAEVLSGLRRRTAVGRDRSSEENGGATAGELGYLLDAPVVVDGGGDMDRDAAMAEVAARSSLILILARPNSADSDGDDDDGTDIIATVELRLQPTDAKIPFSEPWFDRVERGLAALLGFRGGDADADDSLSTSSSSAPSPDAEHRGAPRRRNDPRRNQELQPYLSNLCVARNSRGRRIGRAMVRCVEAIARDSWGYSKIYLHVDLDNAAAFSLYTSEGYGDAGLRWNPFWAGKAADIGYFVKRLSPP